MAEGVRATEDPIIRRRRQKWNKAQNRKAARQVARRSGAVSVRQMTGEELEQMAAAKQATLDRKAEATKLRKSRGF